MSEQKPTLTPEEAHDRMHDALALASTAGDPIFERVSRNPYTDLVEIARANTEEAEVNYTDHQARRNLEVHPHSLSAISYTELSIPQGSYYAELASGKTNAGRASVGRKEYSHKFSRKNEQKAAALITSLAAKRIGNHALAHTDKVASVKNAYLKKRQGQ